jgi:hypothetical protein
MSVAFTVALGTTAPVASLMLPVSALLVPLCARKLSKLTTVNASKTAMTIAVRIRIENELLRLGRISLRARWPQPTRHGKRGEELARRANI